MSKTSSYIKLMDVIHTTKKLVNTKPTLCHIDEIHTNKKSEDYIHTNKKMCIQNKCTIICVTAREK